MDGLLKIIREFSLREHIHVLNKNRSMSGWHLKYANELICLKKNEMKYKTLKMC